MKRVLSILFIGLYCAACATGSREAKTPEEQSAALANYIQNSSAQLARRQEQMRSDLQQKPAPVVDILPVMPVYDPLEDRMVSFSMADEPIQTVLYALAKAVGMNIILDPTIKNDERRLTLHFEKVSAAKVLREILDSYDLYYRAEGGVIRIVTFQEQLFSLNFLNTETNSEFTVGGDVLGVGDSEAIGGLSGNVKLSGRSAAQNNAYDSLEANIKGIVSSNGKYTLNRLSGTLYVKDSPAVVRSVTRLVTHLKEMLDRQILIEARIIEVALSDEHRYGINWSVLREEAADLMKTTLVEWGTTQGFVLSHQEDETSVDAIVEALDTYGDTHVLSNPSIRSKHAKPAVISVGTSYTYKKSVSTTRTSTGTSADLSTEVEVSSVFDGLILGVIPFIEEDGRISLMINPIQSEVDQESLVPEQVSSGTDVSDSISLPQVRIKEISTTISLRNNETAILGGLIDRRKVVEDSGVPGLSKIPLLKYFFTSQVHTEKARELVIILSVTIV